MKKINLNVIADLLKSCDKIKECYYLKTFKLTNDISEVVRIYELVSDEDLSTLGFSHIPLFNHVKDFGLSVKTKNGNQIANIGDSVGITKKGKFKVIHN